MKFLTNSLMAVAVSAFFFTSCGGGAAKTGDTDKKAGEEEVKKAEPKKADPVADNADIAKMSDASKKYLDESSQVICGCLKDHGTELKSFVDEVNPMLSAEKADLKAIMTKVTETAKKMKAFTDCVGKTDAKRDEATKKGLDEDLKKILGEKPESDAKMKKQMEISVAYVSKNCSDNADLFKSFADLNTKMSELRKKK
jgi:hypothetical protein